MKSDLFAYVLVLAMVVACLPAGEMNNLASVRAGDDALKIAVNYIGDDKCREQYVNDSGKAGEVIADNKERVSNLQTHRLNGKNGELISEQFKQVRQRQGRNNWQTLMFSGDKFFGKTADKTLTMEAIRENCRRLVLSVDSDTEPTIEFTDGFAIAQQQAGFKEMALSDEFGTLSCLADKPFCTFANINSGKRYFSLIWPDKSKQAASQVSAEVSWTTGGKSDSVKITIPNLAYEETKPQAWVASGEPNPMPQLQAILPKEPFMASDVRGTGGKGMNSRRVAFANLNVKSAEIEAIDRDNSNGTDTINTDMKATIEIEISVTEPIKKAGTIEIISPEGTVFVENSANLTTKYTSRSGGRWRVEKNHPAGKYGFSTLDLDNPASITFQAPRDAEGNITFSAKITRKGFLGSNTKDFLDKDGNANIVVKFVSSD